MRKIILASTSPRRKELLEQIGLQFAIEGSNYEEDLNLDLEPKELVKHLSLGKAQDVANKHKGEDAVVIGADTVIAFNGKVVGKPHTKERAVEILKSFSGKGHTVLTGFTLVDCKIGKMESLAVETKVFFRDITDEEIEKYVATGEPLDKAGAYALQGKGAILVEKIEGDFSNAIGLPLTSLVIKLKEFGINAI